MIERATVAPPLLLLLRRVRAQSDGVFEQEALPAVWEGGRIDREPVVGPAPGPEVELARLADTAPPHEVG